jgi:N-acetylglucosamine-6-phosphate deacetylase
MTRFAIVGADIFDGERRHAGSALLIDDGRILDILSPDALPPDAEVTRLDGGLLAPGFIDAQVNGGGGVMLNDDPAPDTMAAIAGAHRRFGTTALLPTLITDTAAASAAAIAAAAIAVSVHPGVIGLHLEGPHLAPARKGAHVPDLMRPLTEADVDQFIAAREAIGVLMVTMAVEQAPPALIRRLADAGVIVSLGHSNAGYDDAMRAIQAGARCVTHLFNAMSGLGHRAPGLVGAALDSPTVWCGVISDGHHVHPAALSAAIRAKRVPGRCFLVTDAMSTVGSAGDGFVLNGRLARRREGRLELDDGTLAGSDIDMASSVRFAVERLAVPVDEALRMASLYPAVVLRTDDLRGRIAPGLQADLVWLDRSLRVLGTFIAGRFQPAD